MYIYTRIHILLNYSENSAFEVNSREIELAISFFPNLSHLQFRRKFRPSPRGPRSTGPPPTAAADTFPTAKGVGEYCPRRACRPRRNLHGFRTRGNCDRKRFARYARKVSNKCSRNFFFSNFSSLPVGRGRLGKNFFDDETEALSMSRN